MSFCPTACADFDMVEVKPASCKIEYREVNLRSLAFYKCDVKLPSPLDAAALEALVTAGGLVFSNELVNVSFADPVTEERKLSDSRPAKQEIVERQVNFEDRIKVEVPGDTPNLFLDYDFWQDKIDHEDQLNYAFVMKNGDFVAPVDENGYGLKATFTMFRNFENLQRGGAIEIKAGTLTFQGDPLSMKYKPLINLNTVTALNGKW
ncbi:hypothetical protein [Empedobacter sp.]|uniref:hypothetical protein n=1 Tax=Empedobacter sp. TaxID=1927715 RepID=UPI00289D33A8|nr:hypothetical protein [Empedobacter sp.]